jgi:putative transposase
VQSCVVHLVRNSLRYAGKQHWSKISADLKKVYTAPTVAAAEAAFADFATTWRPKFPAMVAMWERSWTEFVPFLDFPPEVRKLVYTTDEIVKSPHGFGAGCVSASRRPGRRSAVRPVRPGLLGGAVLFVVVLTRHPR